MQHRDGNVDDDEIYFYADARVWFGVVWCGMVQVVMYVASYMHVRAARRRDQDWPQLISDMLSVSNCPKSFLQWVCTCMLACAPTNIRTDMYTQQDVTARGAAWGQRRARHLSRSNKLFGMGW